MKPRISVITLAVADLKRSLQFYRDGLGFPTEGIVGEEFEHGAVAFFELESRVRLALWPRKSMAHDTGLALEKGAPGFTLGHNVGSKNEVDSTMRDAEKAGATVVKSAADTFYGGYAGYVQDPDDHLWEIVWNPEWSPED